MEWLFELVLQNCVISLIVLIAGLLGSVAGIFPKSRRPIQNALSFKVPIWTVIILCLVLFYVPWSAIEEAGPLKVIQGKSFGVQQVHLDGYRFERCKFNGTEIVFSGKRGVDLVENSFYGCKFTFSGPAALVLKFLTKFYQDPGSKEIIEATFESIKRDQVPESAPITKQ